MSSTLAYAANSVLVRALPAPTVAEPARVMPAPGDNERWIAIWSLQDDGRTRVVHCLIKADSVPTDTVFIRAIKLDEVVASLCLQTWTAS